MAQSPAQEATVLVTGGSGFLYALHVASPFPPRRDRPAEESIVDCARSLIDRGLVGT